MRHKSEGTPNNEIEMIVIALIGIIKLRGSIIILYAYNKKKLTVIFFKYL